MAVVEKVHSNTEISFQKVRKFFKNYGTYKRSQFGRTFINNTGQFEQQNNNGL